ncbi:hypothetical protein PAXRUDRAFT_29056 [Paxillus rubicundulus Ve08.2h10]|uniref:Uncharacterized protein n=1 Tax=Paxillus rubicundulus Ve08.2h10 TaxID=930991 RepID=A0A0D0CKC8_9AGAM|nr:hypothetical protein PAXRUDRAFT_29056 [Paxillus rubicundulus Ve08.2h10]
MSKRVPRPTEKAQALDKAAATAFRPKPTVSRSKESNKRSTSGLQATVHTEEEEIALHRDTVIVDVDGTEYDTEGPTRPSTVRKRPQGNSDADKVEKSQVKVRSTAAKRSKTKKHATHEDGGEETDETSDAELG